MAPVGVIFRVLNIFDQNKEKNAIIYLLELGWIGIANSLIFCRHGVKNKMLSNGDVLGKTPTGDNHL